MKHWKFLACSVAIFLLSAHLAVADMMVNDSDRLISRNEVEKIVKDSECCNFDYISALENEYLGLSAQNYKFDLPDGNSFYMIIEGIGAHTYHYLGFLDGDDFIKPELIAFERPVLNLELGKLSIKRDQPAEKLIANPSFDTDTLELLSWDFTGAGERSHSIVYAYDQNVAEFILKKFSNNINLPDGTQVDLNVQFSN